MKLKLDLLIHFSYPVEVIEHFYERGCTASIFFSENKCKIFGLQNSYAVLLWLKILSQEMTATFSSTNCWCVCSTTVNNVSRCAKLKLDASLQSIARPFLFRNFKLLWSLVWFFVWNRKYSAVKQYNESEECTRDTPNKDTELPPIILLALVSGCYIKQRCIKSYLVKT